MDNIDDGYIKLFPKSSEKNLTKETTQLFLIEKYEAILYACKYYNNIYYSSGMQCILTIYTY